MVQTKESKKEYNAGWYERNAEKSKTRSLSWRVLNPGKRDLSDLKYNLKKYFDMSIEEFELRIKKQKGVCAICQRTCKVKKRLGVDHCHISGQNRGLLCHHCNLGLGHFEDDVVLLEGAINYLKEYNEVS